MKRLVVVTGLTLALTIAVAGPANADTTLGSTAWPAGAATKPCSNAVIIQVTSDPATPYAVPTPPVGSLTSWQVNTVASTAGTPVTLLLLRLAGANTYTVVGADTQVIPSGAGPIATFTVSTPIAVSGGEIMALFAPSGFTCYFQEGATPLTDSLISAGTVGTPVVGQTLTEDDSSGPGFTLNVAATLKAPVAKKKCKKHKKKRSAESAKKKCKKKKKH